MPTLTMNRRAAPAAHSDYKKAGNQTSPLTVAEERLLGTRFRRHGDERALDLLVQSHLRLAMRVAYEFRHAGPPMEDLIQEAMVGLTIAARRFDPNRRARLATYATYWIRACILEHVVRTRGPVRIGTTRAQRRILFGLGRLRRSYFRAGQEIERVDRAELAAALKVSQAELAALLPRLTGRDMALDDDRIMAKDGGRGLLKSHAPNPEECYAEKEEQRERQRILAGALRKLEGRQRDILMARCLTGQPETLAEVGERLGLSRERVRQLETQGKRKLRELVGVASRQRGPVRRS